MEASAFFRRTFCTDSLIPWTSLGVGHGCSVLKRTRPWTHLVLGMDALFSERSRPFGFGHWM